MAGRMLTRAVDVKVNHGQLLATPKRPAREIDWTKRDG